MTLQIEHGDALLAVDQLPAQIAGLAKGSTYGILSEDFGVRSALTLRTLAANTRTVPSVLITEQSPSAVVRRMAAWGIDAERQLESGALTIFSKRTQWNAKMLQHGPDRFLRELEYFGVGRNRLILVDHADDLLSARDIEVAVRQARIYHDWVAENGHILLALFARRGTDALGSATLRAAAECFAGFASIDMIENRGALRIEHWYAAHGGATAHTTPVVLGADGVLRAERTGSGELPASKTTVVSAPTAPAPNTSVLATARAFIALGRPLGAWTVVDDFDSAIAAVRSKKFGAVALHYDRETDLGALARAVSALRATGGAQLGIAVRECGRRLRFPNELALIKLGANVVLHGTMPIREVALALEAIRGQTFSRPIELSADEALRSIALLEHAGLVQPKIFVRLATDMLDRSARIGVPNVLAVLKRAEKASMQDAVRATHARRLGDFFAYDDKHCYAFLSACNGEDASRALESMFGHELERHFAAIDLNDTSDAARAALAELSAHIRSQSDVDERRAPTTIERAQQSEPSRMRSAGVADGPGLSVVNPART